MEKILIKADNKWVHFCYITSEMRKQFERVRGQHNFDSIIAKWALDDFNIVIETVEDVQTLKDEILSHYEEKYPFLFIGGVKCIDRMGFTRLWVQENLYEEVRRGI